MISWIIIFSLLRYGRLVVIQSRRFILSPSVSWLFALWFLYSCVRASVPMLQAPVMRGCCHNANAFHYFFHCPGLQIWYPLPMPPWHTGHSLARTRFFEDPCKLPLHASLYALLSAFNSACSLGMSRLAFLLCIRSCTFRILLLMSLSFFFRMWRSGSAKVMMLLLQQYYKHSQTRAPSQSW